MNEYDELLKSESAALGNEYDDLIRQDATASAERKRLRHSALMAQQTTPDAAAEAQRLARRTGVPAPVVGRNLELVRNRADLNEYDRLLTDAPALGRQMQRPEFAAVARDDIETLSTVDQVLRVFGRQGRALVSGIPTLSAGIYGTVEGAAQLGSQALEPLVGSLLPENPLSRVAAGIAEIRRAQQFLAQRVAGDTSNAGFVESAILSGVQSIGMNLPPLAAGLATGNPGLPLVLMAASSGGLGVAQAVDEGLSGSQAAVYGLNQGVIEALTERIPVGRLLGDLQAGRPLLETVLRTTAAEIPREQAATVLQDLNEWAALNPGAPVSQYLAERPEAAAQTLIATIVGSAGQTTALRGVQAAANAIGRRAEQAAQAEQDAAVLQQVTDLAGQSKLAGRDAEAFEQFVDAAAEDGPVQDVFVDANTLVETLNQSGMDPQTLGPEISARVAEAAAAGGAVRFSIGEYAARLATSPAAPGLLPNLRTDALGMTQAEAQTFMQSAQEELQVAAAEAASAAEIDASFEASARVVRDTLLSQLDTANRFTRDVNRAYTDGLLVPFYGTLARRMGTTPEEAFARYPLRVGAEPVVGPGLEQSAVLRPEDVVPDGLLRVARDLGGTEPAQTTLNPEVEAQAIETLAPLAKAAEANKPAFDAALTALAADVGGIAHLAPVKSLTRAAEKLLSPEDANGDPGRIRDMLRATVEVDTEREAANTLERLAQRFTVIRVKDRFTNPTVVGHSDYLVNVRLQDGTVAEVQISTPEMLAAKEVAHPLYSRTRTMDASSPEAQELKAVQKRVYAAAREAAEVRDSSIIASNSAREPGVPFQTAEATENLRGSGSNATATRSPGSSATAVPSTSSSLEPSGSSSGDAGSLGVSINGSLPENRDQLDQGAGNRGAISFGENITDGAVIALLRGADLSTFIHESGHFFLEVYSHLAAQGDAPPTVAEDLDAVLRWGGIDGETAADRLATWRGMTLDQKRETHERFARGFEAYLFEGKAPSAELRSLFGRFRAWMVNVYRSLRNLNVELTDEVRAVFDRMLASEQDVAAAQAARGMAPVFDAPGVVPAERWQAYQELGEQATDEAVEHLERRSLRDMQWLSNAKARALKALQQEAAAKRKAVRAEVTDEVRQQPLYAAMRFLKRGELRGPDGEDIEVTAGNKLNLGEMEALYGDDPGVPWRNLGTGRYGMLGREGMPPDTIAGMFGFSSGDHLVRALLEAQPEQEVIDGLTDQRMLERYGDLSSADAIERAANEAVHNRARARFVATELQALQSAMSPRERTARGGSVNVLNRAAREYAEAVIARTRIRDVRPTQYEAAEARAARAADRAVRAGDLAAGLTEKRNQLVQHHQARAGYAAQDAVDKGLRYLRKFDRPGTRQNLDPDYLEQIDAMLTRFDLRRISNRQADRRKSLQQWIEAQEEMGFEPVIDDALRDEARRTPYRELTVEEFSGLVDAVKNIEHLGRLKSKLLTAAKQRDFAEAVAAAEQSIRDNARGRRPQQIESNSRADQVAAGVGAFFASHRKLASVLRQMDGDQDGGTMWELLMRPLNAAMGREATMREAATKELTQILDPLLSAEGAVSATARRARQLAEGNTEGARRDHLRQRMWIPALGASLSREGRIAVALNWGNAANRQRLVDGDGWTPDQVEAVLSSLTREELDTVNALWRFLDSYWAEIAAKERRVTGVEPQKVEATPFTVTLPDGETVEMRGGYYPIKYDPARSSRAEADSLAETVRQAMQGLYTRATTRRGHTKARVDQVAGRPVRKDLGVVFEHVTQVIHDVTLHEYLIDANRLMRATAIDTAIRDHYGPETLRQIKNTLRDVAAGDVPAQDTFESAINHLRFGATIAGLGWNVGTAALQPLGLTQSMVRIGPKWVGRGLSRWLRDASTMENTAAWIYDRSDFMRLRGQTLQREISEIRNRVTGRDSAIETSFFWLIQKLQLVADIPTWLGQYEKTMERSGDEAQAIAEADQAVLDAQGGGQLKDLAAIQRGGAFKKLWTNFYSYFNTTYNLTAEAVGRTRFKDPLSVARLGIDMLMLHTIPAVLTVLLRAALKGEDLDEDDLPEKLAREQLNYLLGAMVGLREIGGAVAGYANYSGPAGTRFFSEISRLVTQAGQGEVDEALVQSLNSAGGILFHYPAGQVQRTVEGVIALSEDETDNPLVVITGPER